MLQIISFLIGPVVGGVIGGFTNKLAIRMLFRPYKSHHIGPVHIPFTPGIIPKNKQRLAENIGDMVAQQLLSQEVLSATLLSTDMEMKISGAIDGVIGRMLADTQSLQQFLSQYLPAEQVQKAADNISHELTETVYAKLADERVGQQVAQMVLDHVAENPSNKITALLGAAALSLFRPSLERKLTSVVNTMLRDNGRQIVSGMIGGEVGKVMDKPIAELCRGREELLGQLKGGVLKAYRDMVTNNLPQILATLNIRQIVEDRINEMDMAAMEKMIIQTADKELKALVWFGVLLGFFLGFITNIL